MRLRNNILLHYIYRVGPKLGKGVCPMFRIPCACPVCVSQLDKLGYQIVHHKINQDMSMLKAVTITAYLAIPMIVYHRTIRHQYTKIVI